MKPIRLFALLFASFAAISSPPAGAQTPSDSTATIRGTVRNIATAANLDQASVRVAGQSQEILTERDGTFVISGLLPGTYELTASYVGLESQTKSLTLAVGQTVNHDFELTSALYKMDAFVVAGEFEGNAAEINKRRPA